MGKHPGQSQDAWGRLLAESGLQGHVKDGSEGGEVHVIGNWGRGSLFCGGRELDDVAS